MNKTASATLLTGLKRERPEWSPWLAVVEEILRETGARDWDESVPLERPQRQGVAPMLAGVALSVQARYIRRLLDRLIRVAVSSGTPKMRTLKAALYPDLDALALFSASLCQRWGRVEEAAGRWNADPEALQALAALLPVPFLQACNSRWTSSIPEGWVGGYRPICGSWPAFAEVRGIERRRYFRCGRCGGEWHARALCCPYCAMDDHNELVALVPEKAHSPAVIDACRRCLGYVKTFARLQGCPPGAVLVEDLASVAFDVAAVEQGFKRPSEAGYPFDVTVTDRAAARRFLVWNA